MILTVVFGYLFPYLSYDGTSAGPATGTAGDDPLAQALPSTLVAGAVQGFPLFAGALALILGVLTIGSEFGWQTTKLMFTAGPRRIQILAGKVAALLLVMLALVIATFLVDAVSAWVVAVAADRPVHWPGVAELARGVLGGWLIVGMWALLGMALAVLVRGTALAVGLGLVWTLAVEALLRLFASAVDAIDVVQRAFPGTNAGSLAAALGVPPQGSPGGTPGVSTAVSGGQAAVVLGAYLVLFTAAAALLLRQRDVS
jgi:ABC-type transport system involved in multi-copper enzyme maturation permease subunit